MGPLERRAPPVVEDARSVVEAQGYANLVLLMVLPLACGLGVGAFALGFVFVLWLFSQLSVGTAAVFAFGVVVVLLAVFIGIPAVVLNATWSRAPTKAQYKDALAVIEAWERQRVEWAEAAVQSDLDEIAAADPLLVEAWEAGGARGGVRRKSGASYL